MECRILRYFHKRRSETCGTTLLCCTLTVQLCVSCSFTEPWTCHEPCFPAPVSRMPLSPNTFKFFLFSCAAKSRRLVDAHCSLRKQQFGFAFVPRKRCIFIFVAMSAVLFDTRREHLLVGYDAMPLVAGPVYRFCRLRRGGGMLPVQPLPSLPFVSRMSSIRSRTHICMHKYVLSILIIPLLSPAMQNAPKKKKTENAGHVAMGEQKGRAQPRRQVPVRTDAHQDSIPRQEQRGHVPAGRYP